MSRTLLLVPPLLWMAFQLMVIVAAFQLQVPTSFSTFTIRPASSWRSSYSPSSSPSSLKPPMLFNKLESSSSSSSSSSPTPRTTALFSGTGIAKDYTWKEEAFEIEVSVKVPRETRASDILYKATPNSIDLRLKLDEDDDNEKILLDGNRKMRGRISLDGTYWVIADYNDVKTSSTDNSGDDVNEQFREVTVTIEKLIRSPKNDFEVVDYDWKGVYPNDDEEVSFRKYDEAEELNVREYAESLGVDIDNINMSMVDKTMYSSGLNLTQSSLDELTKAGLVKEVTQQNDGSEFVVNPETGETEPYPPLGGNDETTAAAPLRNGAAATATTPQPQHPSSAAPKIPLLDTDSPWHKATPSQQSRSPPPQQQTPSMDTMTVDAAAAAARTQRFDNVEKNQTIIKQTREFTRAAFAKDATAAPDGSAAAAAEAKRKKKADLETNKAKDPIDLLTVKRLKEILKSQGQKVTGNKKELQDRLRAQVNTLLQGKQEQ